MVDVDYGYVNIRLAELMEKQNVSISKLAYRAEMQRSQLKAYMKQEVARIDLAVVSRLCYALECDLNDILEYVPPVGGRKESRKRFLREKSEKTYTE